MQKGLWNLYSNFQLLDLQLRSPRIAHPSNILASVYWAFILLLVLYCLFMIVQVPDGPAKDQASCSLSCSEYCLFPLSNKHYFPFLCFIPLRKHATTSFIKARTSKTMPKSSSFFFFKEKESLVLCSLKISVPVLLDNDDDPNTNKMLVRACMWWVCV